MWPLNRKAEQITLLEARPSRWDTDPIRRATGLFRGLVGIDDCSLEFAAAADEVRFYIRTGSSEGMASVQAQLRAAYPQAEMKAVPVAAHPFLDPARKSETETDAAVEVALHDKWTLPLATKWRDGDDPLASVLAAATQAGEGERVLCQLALGRAPERWGNALELAPPSSPGEPKRYDGGSSTGDVLPMVALFAIAAALFQGYLCVQAGKTLLVVVLGVVGLLLLALIAALVARWRSRGSSLTRQVAAEKLAEPALSAQLRVIAFGQATTPLPRLRALAQQVARSYRAFDHPSGNSLRPRTWSGNPQRPQLQHGLFRSTSILNAAELSGLWHLPCDGVALTRTGAARRVLPESESVTKGSPVGTSSHQGAEVAVHMPQPLLFRHHLIVAKTRRGKSTLLLHMASHLAALMASGKERVALVLIDPHQDLAEAVLEQLPAELAERVVYLNLADKERPIGLNLLDVGLFPDRDRTAENIVTMMHRLWPDNWGPRMEGALRACVECLHQANQVRAREQQYTLLDVVPMLVNGDFREEVLKQVPDPSLWAWWRDNYERISRVFQQQTANPVTTKIGRFLVNEAVRLLVGQPRSTVDPKALLRDGGILIVNSAVGILGEGASSLVGATVLNLMGLMVEEQVAVPPDQRRRVVALVDESSTLGAADYQRMLSELGKYGASFVLVTQSLARLDVIDRSLRPTIMSNIDGLTVFQVSAEDGRFLAPELGSDLEVADLTSLDDFECYARWWSSGRRLPAFSLRLRPPGSSNPARGKRIAQASSERFGRPRAEVAAEVERLLSEHGTRLTPPNLGQGETDSEEGAQDGEEPLRPTKRVNARVPARSRNRDGRRST